MTKEEKKDEEMVEEYLNEKCKDCYMCSYSEHKNPYKICQRRKDRKQAFLAGLKAGRPQWHDLEKDPTDLPKDKHDVWCKALDHYGEGWYDKDTNTWTLIYRGYLLHCIEAWCEIPTFDKE